MSMSQVGRLVAADPAKAAFTLNPESQSVVIENQLSTPLYAAYGRPASATDWDFVVPGSALWAIPVLGGETNLNVFVDYAGGVVAGDVQAIIWESPCNFPPFVGAIA